MKASLSTNSAPRHRWSAVLVDDERLARVELRRLLQAHPDINVVAEASDVAGAAERVRLTDADVVFLDLQLGHENGLDLMAHLDSDVHVICVTAHERFAVGAFSAQVLDYLLKPVVPERLAQALRRLPAPNVVSKAPGVLDLRSPTRSASDVVDDARAVDGVGPLTMRDRLFLRTDAGMEFIAVASIRAVEADRDASWLSLIGGRRVRTAKPLAEWRVRLPARHFQQIHRSTMVNVEQIARIEPWSQGSFTVILRGEDAQLVMSRRFASQLRARLG